MKTYDLWEGQRKNGIIDRSRPNEFPQDGGWDQSWRCDKELVKRVHCEVSRRFCFVLNRKLISGFSDIHLPSVSLCRFELLNQLIALEISKKKLVNSRAFFFFFTQTH